MLALIIIHAHHQFFSISRIHLISLCLMELHFYPFDIQNCTLEIASCKSKEFLDLEHC